eukprot:39811-Lingulodinium_polyedra.AAC.1
MGRERRALPQGLRDHAVTRRGHEARCDVDVLTIAKLEDGVPRHARRRVDPVRLRRDLALVHREEEGPHRGRAQAP